MQEQNHKSEVYPVFAINLKQRIDRRESILKQFEHKQEFKLKIIEAIEHDLAPVSLWQTLKGIIKETTHSSHDFIIVCEDDHVFTKFYTTDFFLNCLYEARLNDADILSGGISWVNKPIQISSNLFWVEQFNGLQFTVVFKKFFPCILNAHFGENDAADFKISNLTDKKFIVYPFLSIQKEFGYSDVTSRNNKVGRIGELFEKTSKQLEILSKARNFYFK